MGELKVLILGDGLLGSEIHKQTGWDFTSRKKGFNIRNIELIDKKYTTILNCIAHTDTYSEDKEIHWDVNCVFVKNLIYFCNKNNIKLITFNVDCFRKLDFARDLQHRGVKSNEEFSKFVLNHT